jgi:hypothetical protein
MENDQELYKGMKFSNLLEEIVDNSRNKRNQIDILISDLRAFIKSPGDALGIVPLIKDYIDVGVKNDDQLVKVAAVFQRSMASTSNSSGKEADALGLSEEERKNLQDELDKMKEEEKSNSDSIKKIEEKSEKKKSELI